ncbi:SDR family oxidoreductase [Niabella hibiscisoli]|uniref:SDR family oxidoreductase n=1 Tax=Niabella hibiscisoli TaxID=1825928 RepID=UPI001F0E2DEA|nr:SDR family oxidoreductase [Niabella hibiscisoli]MCH5719712.1 SDR family oxidoreductase [Niabella hibiscisoli]
MKHHIALSVVGTSQLQESGYFRAKQVQEDMIKASGIPYTIVHATQFFEFAGSIVQMSAAEGKVVVPDANIQPIASKDVVSFLAKTALEQPANSILEIGGPEKFGMAGWIGDYIKVTGKGIEVVADAKALYSGSPLEKDTLAPQSPVYLGASHYAEWIADTANQR